MKKLIVTLLAVMSVFLFITSGVFAENSDPEPKYNGKFYMGLDSENTADLDSKKSNEKQLYIAFNGKHNKTKVVVVYNSDDTAWNQYGEKAAEDLSDAVVIYDKETNTLTLSGYHYKGEGYQWQQGQMGGYSGIYANNLGTLTIKVEADSSIDLDGISDPQVQGKVQGNSIGILGNGDTSINILGAPGAVLDVQHGPAGGGAYTKSGAIMAFEGLSVATDTSEDEETPFKLVCHCEEKLDSGFEFYGLYAVNDDINLTNIELDIESASKENDGGHSIGIAAAGTNNSVNIDECFGIVKGGGGVTASEAIHCGSLNAYVSGENNNLTIKNSSLELIAGAGKVSSYALGVMHKVVIDNSILTLETDSEAETSFGLIQSEADNAQLSIQNQSDITASGKDGAIVYDKIVKKELDFSKYGENLKVEAGSNEEKAVLLENPQDCVGLGISYVHIYAQEDPAPVDPVEPVNPATGIDNSHTGTLACAVTLIVLAAGCLYCFRKREN